MCGFQCSTLVVPRLLSHRYCCMQKQVPSVFACYRQPTFVSNLHALCLCSKVLGLLYSLVLLLSGSYYDLAVRVLIIQVTARIRQLVRGVKLVPVAACVESFASSARSHVQYLLPTISRVERMPRRDLHGGSVDGSTWHSLKRGPFQATVASVRAADILSLLDANRSTIHRLLYHF